MSYRRHCRVAAVWTLICAAGLVGCDSLGERKFGNPVSGPPPKRISLDEPPATVDRATSSEAPVDSVDTSSTTASDSDTASDSPDIKQTDFSPSAEGSPEAVPGGEVAVVVNGEPIFVDDVLESLPSEASEQLVAIRRRSTPEEFEVYRRKLAKQFLRPLIERTVLVQALHEVDKPEKIKALTSVLDTSFDKYVTQVMDQMGVSTRGELQVKLKEQKTSIESLREAFRNDQMARYYLSQESPEPKKPERPELLSYYQEHIEDYTIKGQVRWQQIVLPHRKYGGAEKTAQLAQQLIQKLQAGEDFGELAKQYSTGPTGGEGGVWDWTRQGSLASKDVEQQLFSLPEGDISQPISRKDSVEIVRVLERKDAGRKPFESVQADIEKHLQESGRREATADLIRRLVSQAEVTVLLQ